MSILIDCEDTAPEDFGTVVVFRGTNEDGAAVRFGVDHRVAQGLLALVEDNGSIPCSVEPWQILKVGALV